jgi:Tol biopolymer transport system component
MKSHQFIVICLVFVFVLVSAAYGQQTAEQLYQSALYKEEIEGEMDAAIKIYETVIKQYPENRSVAAKTQLHIGLCYEKLGLKEAQKAYQKVVDKYPEQTEAVKLANEKLSLIFRVSSVVGKGDSVLKMTKIFESSEKSGFLSPDGKKLALIGKEGDIWVREIASGKETRLTQTPSYKYWCFWSPNSELIAYLDDLGGLYVVSAKGGEPRPLIRSDSDFIKEGNYAWPTGWTSDNQMILCQVYRRGLCAIPISGGDWKDIFKIPAQYSDKDFNLLTLSPNGKFIAYESTKSGNSDIYVMPVDGGNSIQITRHSAPDTEPTWSFDGKWIAFITSRSGTNEIWVTRISPDGNPEGESLQIFRGFSGSSSSYNWMIDGEIAISKSTGVSNIFVRELQTGKEIQLTNILTFESHPRWSPDGSQIAFISRRDGESDLWTIPSEGGEAKKVTVNVPNPNATPRYISRPSWLPDGKSLAFGGIFGEDRGIWTVPAKGGIPEKMISDFGPLIENCDVSPDGAFITFDYIGVKEGNPIKNSRNPERDIYVIPFKGGSPQRITKMTKSGLSFISPCWSHDGKMIAFRSTDEFEGNEGKDAVELWVCKFPEGEPKAITEKMKGNIPCLSWSPDGKAIIFSIFEKDKFQIYSVPADGGKIKQMDIEGFLPDYSPDGKSIVFGKLLKSSFEYWLIENFLPK